MALATLTRMRGVQTGPSEARLNALRRIRFGMSPPSATPCSGSSMPGTTGTIASPNSFASATAAASSFSTTFTAALLSSSARCAIGRQIGEAVYSTVTPLPPFLGEDDGPWKDFLFVPADLVAEGGGGGGGGGGRAACPDASAVTIVGGGATAAPSSCCSCIRMSCCCCCCCCMLNAACALAYAEARSGYTIGDGPGMAPCENESS
mmetsp:Transcript_13916/g.34813  ORF Transcript_13916/g.34813 Transcript_13916/m.34813 type:complete len:206 (+) Transcript_13916:874-1491(+)